MINSVTRETSCFSSAIAFSLKKHAIYACFFSVWEKKSCLESQYCVWYAKGWPIITMTAVEQ